MEIEYRKAFADYIHDCQKPEKKKAAEQVMDQLNTRRKYKAEILENPSGMKLQAGKTYKAEVIQKPAADQKKRQPGGADLTDEERITREYQKNELRHLCQKGTPGYDDTEYQNRKADLIIQLATLKAGGKLQRTADEKLIEHRSVSFTNIRGK